MNEDRFYSYVFYCFDELKSSSKGIRLQGGGPPLGLNGPNHRFRNIDNLNRPNMWGRVWPVQNSDPWSNAATNYRAFQLIIGFNSQTTGPHGHTNSHNGQIYPKILIHGITQIWTPLGAHILYPSSDLKHSSDNPYSELQFIKSLIQTSDPFFFFNFLGEA